MIEATEKIALNEENIWQAIKDYRRHTSQTGVLDDVSEVFVKKLARNNYYAKQKLRELFRKSPVWNEKLDALIINGTRTHDPDYQRIKDLALQILQQPIRNLDDKGYNNLEIALRFFWEPDLREEVKNECIASIEALAPRAYAPGKKPTRVFRALCTALGVNDETCEKFSWLYAQLADEITSHKIDFKLFVSLNPAHFLTMSNPKDDERGDTLTSCHSFNSMEYDYNNGCSGYARDKYTFIVFTVVDPTNVETLNNRKNRRQIFWYKPGNGVLLQSRLYNDAGGTHREQTESKVYRDLIQREISALEEQPNLWKTFKYCGYDKIKFHSGYGFGGYEDWIYEEFNAKVSIRVDHKDDYEDFEIGTWGLCITCGCEIDKGLYCDECKDRHICECCNNCFNEDDLYIVHEQNGETLEVCKDCRNRYYAYCDDCGEYYPQDDMTETMHGNWVCPDCLESIYIQCAYCGGWVKAENTWTATDHYGDEVSVCECCIDEHYTLCDDCEGWVLPNDTLIVYDEHDYELNICPECLRKKYEKCRDCDRFFKADLMENWLCPDCATKK